MRVQHTGRVATLATLALMLAGTWEPATASDVALVIGNSAYEGVNALRTPRTDAKAMAAKLRRLGFRVLLRLDLDHRAFEESLSEFGAYSDGASRAVLYYSGHGLQMNGENYLVPVESKENKGNGGIDVSDAVPLDHALEFMGGQSNYVFLDASRKRSQNPAVAGQGQGLAPQCVGLGMLVALAAAPGTVQTEGNGRLSPFTKALLTQLGKKCVSVWELRRRVNRNVRGATDNAQRPRWYAYPDSLQDWRKCPPKRQTLPTHHFFHPPWPGEEQDAWRRIQHSKSAAVYAEFLKNHPVGLCCKLAKYRREQYRQEEQAWDRVRGSLVPEEMEDFLISYPNGQFSELAVRSLAHLSNGNQDNLQLESNPIPAREWTNSLGMEFVLIPDGTFNMGSTIDMLPASSVKFSVRIREAFYLGKHEVTQGQWEAVMGSNPSQYEECGSECPVENVSWNQSQEFIKRLNEMEGKDLYRLPSEAEWEYAARAGSNEESYGDLDEIAWWLGNMETWQPGKRAMRTHPVGQKKANSLGLHDMLGNVWEWTQDWYWAYEDMDGQYKSQPLIAPSCLCMEAEFQFRVLRGCSWNNNAVTCRSAFRSYGPQANTHNADWSSEFHDSAIGGSIGFRVLRRVR